MRGEFSTAFCRSRMRKTYIILTLTMPLKQLRKIIFWLQSSASASLSVDLSTTIQLVLHHSAINISALVRAVKHQLHSVGRLLSKKNFSSNKIGLNNYDNVVQGGNGKVGMVFWLNLTLIEQRFRIPGHIGCAMWMNYWSCREAVDRQSWPTW